MADKQKFAFDKTNFILLAIGSLLPGLYFYDIRSVAQT